MGSIKFYVGIDPSLTNTGLVILDNNMQVYRATESKGNVVKSTKAARLAALKSFLMKNLGPEVVSVGYEDYSYNSINKSFTLGELGGVYKLTIFESLGMDPHLIAPNKLKSFATGHGGASKEQMVCAASTEGFGNSCTYSHDICDAYFLAKYAMYRVEPELAARLDTNKKLVRHRLEVAIK